MAHPRRFITLLARLSKDHPELDDPLAAVRGGDVLVNGIPTTNPRSLVTPTERVSLRSTSTLRGTAKLAAALDGFGVVVHGRIALDVGAAAGGFTRVLLDAGAARVYAVDAGYGQLRGTIRQDPRVVVLERTNIADLSVRLVPDEIEVVAMDLSYVAVADAIGQLDALRLHDDARLIALVKPMFELGVASLPGPERFEGAVARAVNGVMAAGWHGVKVMRSPVAGSRGATEFLLHARRGGQLMP